MNDRARCANTGVSGKFPYMKYLTGCAKMFRIGYIDVNQFTLEK